MSDDLISRKAAIETAKKMYVACDTNSIDDYEMLMEEALKVLPSAQPEPCEDAVSREVLKDGFTEMCNLICPYTKKQQHVMCGSCLMGTAFDVLETTPSVTPKQRKGKWVLVCDNNGMHFICNQCGEWRYHQEQEYCGHCGAKMEVTDGDD